MRPISVEADCEPDTRNQPFANRPPIARATLLTDKPAIDRPSYRCGCDFLPDS